MQRGQPWIPTPSTRPPAGTPAAAPPPPSAEPPLAPEAFAAGLLPHLPTRRASASSGRDIRADAHKTKQQEAADMVGTHEQGRRRTIRHATPFARMVAFPVLLSGVRTRLRMHLAPQAC